MNARPAIQRSDDPLVLDLAFSPNRQRFVAALSEGLQVFRTDNCLTTFVPPKRTTTLAEDPIALAAILDDRYIAYVPRTASTGANVTAQGGSGKQLVFFDTQQKCEVAKFDLHESIQSVHLTSKWLAVVLQSRTVIFAYYELQSKEEEGVNATRRGPSRVHALCSTAANPYALASLSNTHLVLPAPTTGQVQIVPLPQGSKRVLRAHNTALRCLALSPDSSLLATASEQGTLIRVFNTRTLDQIAEFRRGVEKAIIYSLSFSNNLRWLACTSDKGTLHIFDLRPAAPAHTVADHTANQAKRNPPSYATKRLSAGTLDRETSSSNNIPSYNSRAPSITPSAPIVPGSAGSIQEYYGLRPPPTPGHSISPPGKSAVSAIKTSSWAPKALKDVRSVASAPIWTGDEGPWWQLADESSHVWTMAPNGTRRRVKNAIPPRPGDPSGRPKKGVVFFAPADADGLDSDDSGATLHVLGGGREGRWEKFDLVPDAGSASGWTVFKQGFRRFLSPTFID